MKIILKLLFAFLTLTTYSYATWYPYIGLGVGLSKSQNSFKTNYSDVITSDSLTINMDTTGTSESLILGLRQQQASFFIAGELFTSIHQFNIKRKGNVIYLKNPLLPYRPYTMLDFEVDQKYTNGVSMLLGKDLTSRIDVFLKFDFFLSKFTIKYSNSKNPGMQNQENKWIYGYAPGVWCSNKTH